MNDEKPGREGGISYNPIYAACFCVLITFAVYIYPALHNQFTNWDDNVYVTGNKLIQSWSPQLFTAGVSGHWAPVVQVLLAIEYHLFGLNPAGYHLTSLLLHLCNVALVFMLIIKLGRKPVVAGIAALLFGIHPMHVEPVAWVSSQKDLLYTLFYLAAMLMYCKHKEQGNDVGPAKNKYLLLTVIFFILSCLSKALGVTLPVVLALIDSFWENNWNWKFIAKNLDRKIIFLLISVAFGITAYAVQKKAGPTGFFLNYTFGQQMMFACYSFMVYMVKFVAPFHLSSLYPYPLQDAAGMYPLIFYLSPFIVILSAGLLSALVVNRAKKGQSNKTLFFGLLFFIVNIILVSQIITYGEVILAERYSYLSYTGLLFIAASALNTFWEKYFHQLKSIMVAGFCTLALIFLVTTYKYAVVWRDSITLWTHVINNFPSIPMQGTDIAYNDRGAAYADAGKPELAMADYNTAIRLNPRYVFARNNRGTAYYKQGKPNLAIADFNVAISLDPHYADAYTNRGIAYQQTGKTDMAIADYTTAISLNPQDADAYNNRGTAYYNQGKPDLAIADYTMAISLNPGGDGAYNNRGIVYTDEGKTALAIADYTSAINLNPQYSGRFYKRGNAYASEGKPDLAIADYTTVISLSPQFAGAYNDRGITYANLGKPSLAIADYTMAISLNPGFDAAYNNRGIAYTDLGKPGLAIADYTTAISLNPKFARAFFNRGIAYASLEKPDTAIADYTIAISLNPQFAQAYYNRGFTYAGQGKTDMAIADYTSAISFDPQLARAYYNRGLEEEKQGRHNQAHIDIVKAGALGLGQK